MLIINTIQDIVCPLLIQNSSKAYQTSHPASTLSFFPCVTVAAAQEMIALTYLLEFSVQCIQFIIHTIPINRG